MRYEFALVDVFTDRRLGGNQLAVLPDARGLSAPQMQAIAREVNSAESTFVLPPVTPGASAHLRIFSPGQEMPFAGHPTVGSAAVLARRGAPLDPDSAADVVFDEAIGRVTVTRHHERRHLQTVTVGGDVAFIGGGHLDVPEAS